jgi:hypothetical protein
MWNANEIRMSDDRIPNSAAKGEDESDSQQWIDGLLRSSDAVELERAPNCVLIGAKSAIGKLRRRQMKRRALAGLAVAATLAGMGLWPRSPRVKREGAAEGRSKPTLVQSSGVDRSVVNPSPSPSLRGRGMMSTATFVSTGDAIVVPVASDDAQVSIVKVYPTTTAERRWRRELTLNAGRAGEDGG